MAAFAIILALFLSGLGAVSPVYAEQAEAEWIEVDRSTLSLRPGQRSSYRVRLKKQPPADGWWIRIHVDGTVYIDGVYNGLRWVPSVGWEFNQNNWHVWREVSVYVTEDTGQRVQFTHEVWDHNNECPEHSVGSVTVTVDDTPPPPPPGGTSSLSIADAPTVMEGGEAVFTVTLDPATSQAVTVAYTTKDGTAVGGSDYTTTAGTLRFEPNETTESIRVPILSDSTAEPSENFSVELSNPNGARIADATGSATIEADSMAGLSIADAAPVAEGSEAVFTVTLDPATSQAVTVAYTTKDGTAVGGSDYTTTSGTLRFEPNETTQTVRVPILSDSTAEPSENFTVELSSPNGARVTDAVGAGSIEADPLPMLNIGDAAAVAEGGEAVFTVTLSPASSQEVTVAYTTVTGTAVSGSDFTATSGTLSFDPHGTTQTIRVPILQDAVSESSENFTVTLSSPNRATVSDGTGAGTIAADPMPGLSIADAAPVPEGEDAVFTVTLHPQSSQTVTVAFTTQDGTAVANSDYTTTSGSLSFGAGETTKTIRVPVLQDAVQESSEDFTVVLSNPSGTMLADATGVGTIAADPMPGLTIADAAPVAEGGQAAFEVTLHPASNSVVTVAFTTQDGTAVADSDYTLTSGTLTFNANETTKTIEVPILRDSVHEPSETFTVVLSNPSGTTLADATGLGTIEADPFPGLRIADAAPVAEGREAVFRVTLNPASNHVVAVTYATMDGTAVAGADYTATSGTLRFEPRETTKTIRVPTLQDTATEPSETFTVELSNPTGTTLSNATAVGTIRADASPGLRITDAAPVAEGSEAVFRVTLTPLNDQPVTVSYSTVDGTAVAGSDYAATSGTLRFEPGESTQTIRVQVLRDDVAEPSENFTVGLSNPVGTTIVHGTGLATIEAEAVPGLSIADAATVAEGDEAVFPVTLNPASSQVVTVAYATRDGSALADSDYTATSGRLRFEPGETMQTIRVQTLRDETAEPSENFTVELSDPVATTLSDATGVGTIDADAMPALSITDAAPVAEGEEATFTVSLTPASSEVVTVAYATQDGTAVAGSDFTATSGTLQFDPGVTTQTIQVAALNDTAVEPTETFTVELSNPVRATLADASGVATITDDMEHRVTRAFETGLPEVGRAIAFSAVTCRIDRKMSNTATWDNADRLAGGMGSPGAGGPGMGFPGIGVNGPGVPGATTSGEWSNPAHASMTPEQRLGNLSFLMASQETAESSGGRFAAWGCGDYRRLSGGGDPGTGAWNGEAFSMHVGVDVQLAPNVLAGVSISRSRGLVNYSAAPGDTAGGGQFDLRLIGVHPFLGWSLSPDIELWGTVGHAWGELRMADTLGRMTGAATLNSGAIGLNGRLLTRGATTLRLRGEGGLAQLSADGDTFNVAALDMWRFRLSTELSHERHFSSGTSITPWAELGARHDGGDGETGAGLELGGGLRYRVPQVGLMAEGYGRWLAVHEGTLQEWGVGAMVSIDPGMDGGGLSATVTPSWGETASGIQRLWQYGAANPTHYGASRGQLDAQLGYAFPVFRGRSVLTPFAAVNLAGDDARGYRLGGSLAASRWATLSLELERWERALLNTMHTVMVRGTAKF